VLEVEVPLGLLRDWQQKSLAEIRYHTFAVELNHPINFSYLVLHTIEQVTAKASFKLKLTNNMKFALVLLETLEEKKK